MSPPPPPPPPVTEYLSSSPPDGIIHLTDGLKDIKQPSVQVARATTKKTEIIDIRSSKLELSLKDDIYEGLKKPEGERTLPTLLLYDEAGLNLFQDITYLDEYYLTNAEIQLLEENAFKIAKGIPDSAVIVELGSGNLRKVNILLRALDYLEKNVSYYALDLSLPELQRTLAEVKPEEFTHVTLAGLHGTYDDGKEWFKTSPIVNDTDRPRVILWLGSSIGNFDRDAAAEFVSDFTKSVMRPGSSDLFLIGIDGCKDAEKVWRAYNDSHGVTREFELNGLKNANGVLGKDVFREGEWEYVGVWNGELGCHEAYYEPLKDIDGLVEGVSVKKGERIRVERSYKFSDEEALELFNTAGLVQGNVWRSSDGTHSLRTVYSPPFHFDTKLVESECPSLEEYEQLWKAWDYFTLEVLPKENLHTKPIDLRHDCIFYLGHIPTFLDIQLTRATSSPLTPLPGTSHFHSIFERGIDPDVSDPTICHPHSEIPSEWPALSTILQFRDLVRTRVRNLYAAGEHKTNQKVTRAIWMAYEHEAMHLETFLYMILQLPSLPRPPHIPKPDFASFRPLPSLIEEDLYVSIPETTLTIGQPFREALVWDNETPSRRLTVPAFRISKHLISNSDYRRFLTSLPPAEKASYMPKTWTADGLAVKTLFGPVDIDSDAADWPVMASYNQLAACAKSLGGRLPTRGELQSYYDYEYVRRVEEKDANALLARRFNGVNGHLQAEGVEETPPVHENFSARPSPSLTFNPLPSTTPTSFKHLHPVPNGGVWEWTSTVLEKHEGFVEDPMYPGYTADFFDGKHNVVLGEGGSWATVPRIAGRRSFTNWYQRGYEYAWVGGRVVLDA